MNPGDVHISEDGGIPVVRMVGEFDLQNADCLSRAFGDVTAGAPTSVLVDMAETTYLDSTALRSIYRLIRAGIAVTIRGATGHPRQVLELAGLERSGLRFE